MDNFSAGNNYPGDKISGFIDDNKVCRRISNIYMRTKMTQKATKYLTIMRSTVKKEERMMSCRGMYNAMKDRHGHSSFAFLITKAPQPQPRIKSNCRKNKSTSTQVHPSSFGATIDFQDFFLSRFSKNHSTLIFKTQVVIRTISSKNHSSPEENLYKPCKTFSQMILQALLRRMYGELQEPQSVTISTVKFVSYRFFLFQSLQLQSYVIIFAYFSSSSILALPLVF